MTRPRPNRRVLIAGSPYWSNYQTLVQALDRIDRRYGPRVTVVTGGRKKGVDVMVLVLAEKFGWTVEQHPAIKTGGRRRHDHDIVMLGADECLAFAHSWQCDAGQMARCARETGIPTKDLGESTAEAARPQYEKGKR